MKKFLKWTAIALGAAVTLLAFNEADDLTKWFVILFWVVGYFYVQLSKQIQSNHEAMVRRIDALFNMARGNAAYDDEDL